MSGSRSRYLAEQEAFMAEKFGMDVSKDARLRPRRTLSSEPAVVRRGLGRDKVGVDSPLEKALTPAQNARAKANAATAKKTRAGKIVSHDSYVRSQTTGRNAKRSGVSTQITMHKADSAPLKTNMSEGDAKRVVGRVNMAGLLPTHYSREQRMGAYEARYVAAGGRKGEKWQRRATAGDRAKTVGLAAATAGGAGILAARTKAVSRLKNVARIRHTADTAALTGATAGGAAELYAGRARRKRASYSSAPGGAAASALRRMRAMDEARGQS